MKIFRIIENRIAGNDGICWYMLPDSAIVRTDNPWFVPDFDDEFRLYPVFAVRIDRLGKSVSPKYAPRYYNEAAICMTAYAQNLLHRLREKGLPWDYAVSFDKSCMIGDFMPFPVISEDDTLIVEMAGKIIKPDLAGIKDIIDNTISVVSRNNTIKTGDLILIPVSDEYFIPSPGYNLTAGCSSGNLLEIRIK